ncbi:MAG: DUF853 family protein [Alphaproteobacteria bacterium]|nr:DUF853 family protein [Alphaproteobacteria bacterium]
MNINIGSIQLPINAATKTFAILAKRGAGKSYTAAVMAEEFAHANIPFVVFDPIDVWWGLRVAADGKSKGLPVVVFGIEHADIPLDRDMGRRIAQAIVKENISCVISTFGMPKTAQRHLIAEFADELLNINDTPRHVFIEEAHEFVPQRVMGAMAKTFAAVEALVVMGRNRGIGVTLINQRAATLNKDVLTQVDTLLAFRNVAPQDRKALKEWVEAHSAEGDFDQFMKSLPSLPTGEGWIWSPEFMGVFERIQIRKRETFHPDREKLGSKFEVPTLEQADIQSFIRRFRTAPAKTSDEPEVAAKSPTTVPDSQAIIALRNEYERRLMEKDAEIRRLTAIVSTVRTALGDTENVSVMANTVPPSAVQLWRSKIGNGLAGKIFDLLASNPTREFTKQQIAFAVGASPNAGHTANEFAKLTKTKLMVRDGSLYRLNPNL